MDTSQKSKSPQAWLFDGKSEFIGVNVAAATPMEGGYVVAMKLTTGAIRLAATRQPAKYVSAWRHNVRRYGAPDIVRVLVSRPCLRYEAAKRCLTDLLANYKEADSDAFRVDVDVLTAKAREMFTANHEPMTPSPPPWERIDA
jgi:hypothetical protein